MQSIESAIKLLKEANSIIIGGVTNEMIYKVEGKLAVKLPPSYVYFLQHLGFCMLSPHEFLGIPNKPNDLELGIVRETLTARKAGLPDNFVVIFDAGNGSIFLINTTETDGEGEAAIYAWGRHSEFKENDIRKVYSNYGTFFLDKIQETIKTRKEMDEN